ncbi:hypothetical protein [Mesorhizobium sp. A556]
MNRPAFYAALRQRSSGVFGTSLSQGQVTALGLILDEGEQRGLILTHLAYVLATPYHEVGSALQPKTESLTYTTAARIRAVWPSRFASAAAAQPYVRQPQKLANKVYGGRMGNTGPNDGWTYRGRGLCQITGREMYTKLGNLIGVNLVGDPDAALEPDIAVAIMFEGMIFGLFTGKKLSDYLNAQATDYRGARAIINGDVKANGDKIAGYARAFETALKAASYSSLKPKSGPISGPPPLGPGAAVRDNRTTESTTPKPIKPKASSPETGDASTTPKRSIWAALLDLISKLFGRK